jgi:hypothetical protein
MGAKAGSCDGLQTFDKFASTWFANYDMFACGSTRIMRLANICKHVVGKDIIYLQAIKNNTLFILGNRSPHCAQISIHIFNSVDLWFFCSISSNIAIEKQALL